MFWDRLIQRLYFTFRGLGGDGLRAAARLVAAAHSQRLVDFGDLDDNLSVVLLAALAPPTYWALRVQADREFRRRGLASGPGQGQMWDRLRAAEPDDYSALLRLQRVGHPEQMAQAAQIVEGRHGPWLLTFLTRLYLTGVGPQRDRVRTLVARAAAQHRVLPEGTIGFLCYLYRRHFLPELLNAPLPPADPATVPWATVPQDERPFLEACLSLDLVGRLCVYLSFYAGLTVRDITCILTGIHDWTEVEVASQIEAGYRQALDRLTTRPDPFSVN